MKKLMMLLVAFGLVIGFSQMAAAEPAAVINDDGTCWYQGITLDRHKVFTNNAKGVGKMTCIGEAPDGYLLPDIAEVEVGFACGISGVGTSYDTHAVITPSGQVKMTCKFPQP